jgi:hypothetical protein
VSLTQGKKLIQAKKDANKNSFFAEVSGILKNLNSYSCSNSKILAFTQSIRIFQHLFPENVIPNTPSCLAD